MSDCPNCGGTRLLMGGWMGPTPQRPYPDPCPRCAPDITARERQVIQQEWLLDHQDDPRVKDILAQMAVVNRQRYRLVLHTPQIRTLTPDAIAGSYQDVAEADLIVGSGNMVLKDRYGPAGYVLSDSELRRLRDSCGEYRRR